MLFTVANGDNESAKETVRQGFYEFSQSVDVSMYELTPQELSVVFSEVIKDDPYLFFVDYTMSYSYQPGGFVLSLRPEYSLRGQSAFAAWDFCRQNVRSIASLADKYETDVQKALFVHDYICANYGYDSTLQCDDLYEFFLMGRGTCQSYTAAYMAVLRECGIESHFVASDSIAHIWNYVKIDGEWYHCDLTWDDSGDTVSRRHFLCSDRSATERGHKDWYSSEDIVCLSERFADGNFDDLIHKDHTSGDIDHSGELDTVDLVMLRIWLEEGAENGICPRCADVNCDKYVNKLDVEFLRRKILLYD